MAGLKLQSGAHVEIDVDEESGAVSVYSEALNLDELVSPDDAREIAKALVEAADKV